MSKFLTMLLFTIPITLWHAYALTRLWAWFMVPGFGLAPITMLQAVGIGLFVGLVTYRTRKGPPSTAEEVARLIADQLLAPAFYLGFGWVLRMALT